MPVTGSISFGICPESACVRSYRKGQNLRDGLVHWRNTAKPSAQTVEGAALDPHLADSCRTILQPRPHPRGVCDSCGKPLVFSNCTPELGECPVCRRPYCEEDLGKRACPACDAQVEIDTSTRTRVAAQATIAEILHVIPHLKHYGYLDAFAGRLR